jgi:hypothetical protein
MPKKRNAHTNPASARACQRARQQFQHLQENSDANALPISESTRTYTYTTPAILANARLLLNFDNKTFKS